MCSYIKDYFLHKLVSSNEYHILFAGGADSNISTLYWTLLWLTNNPHIQDKMAQEIHENIGKLLNSWWRKQPQVIIRKCSVYNVSHIFILNF